MAFSEWSVVFDGVDEYADAGDAYGFDRTDAFSISYWVRADPSAGSEFAIAKGASGTPEGWWSLIRSDGKVVFAMLNTFTTNDLRVRADNVNVRDGFWHHVVATHDGTGTAAGVNHIIDGVLASAVTESNNLTGTIVNTATLRFATRENGYPSESLVGNLDEVALYDKALSLGEAQAIFNAGVPLDLSGLSTASNLVGWWRMGDGDTYPTLLNQIIGEAAYPTIPDESGQLLDYLPLTTSLRVNHDQTLDEYADFGSVLTDRDYIDPISMGAWFKTSSGSELMVMWNHGSAYLKYGWGIRLTPSTSQRIWVYRDNGNGYGYSYVASGITLNDGQWHHVFFTWDGTFLKIYLDGVQVTTGSGSGGTGSSFAKTNLGTLWVGNYMTYLGAISNFRFKGWLAHSAVYNTDLSAAQVGAIYGNGTPQDLNLVVPTANLVHWSPLGDGCALGAGNMIDLSPSGSDGTYYNGEADDFAADVPTGPETRIYHDGTMTNMVASNIQRPVPRSSFSKYSLKFDGSNEYLTFGDVLNFERTDAFSISFWFKRTSATGAAAVLCKIQLAGPRGWQTYLTSTNHCTFEMANANPGPNINVYCDIGNASIDGVWHHTVVTWDGDVAGGAAGVNFYLDGVLQTPVITADDLGANTILNNGDLNLGRSSWGANYFNGYLSDVAVYDAELTEAEAQWIYNNGTPRDLREAPLPSAPFTYSPLTTSLDLNNGKVGGYADFGHFAEGSFTLSTPFSFGVWIKWSSTTSGIVFGKYVDAGSTGFFVYVTATDLIFRMDDAGGSGYCSIRLSRVTNDDKWHHIVCTYDGSNPGSGSVQYHMDIYVDGVNGGYSTSGIGLYTISSASAPWRVGIKANSPVWMDPFSGKVCHSFVYNKELDQTEVTALYGSGAPQDLSEVGPSANLVHWCALGNGDAIGAGNMLDLSGLGHDGTTTNVVSEDFVLDAPSNRWNPLAYWRLGDGAEIVQSTWAHKIHQWRFDPLATKESTTITDAGRGSSPGTLYNMTADNVTADTPGGLSKHSCMFNMGPVYSPLTTSIELNNDTVNERIEFGSPTVLDRGRLQVWSVGIWMKTSSAARQTLLSNMNAAGTTGWEMYVLNGILYVKFLTLYGTGWLTSLNRSIADGAWHLVGFSCQGVDSFGDCVLYVDGAGGSQGYSGVIFGGDIITTDDFTVGATNAGTAYFMTGQVCHGFYFDIQLSAAQWLRLADLNSPRHLLAESFAPSLKWWSTLGDGCAVGVGNVLDISLEGNDGTFVNGESGDFVLNVPALAYSPLTTSINIATGGGGDQSEAPVFPDPLACPATGQAFSMGAWFKNSGSANNRFIIGKSRTSSGRSWGLSAVTVPPSILVNWTDNNYDRWYVGINTGTSVLDGSWHHVVWTYDGVSTHTIYLDGAATVASGGGYQSGGFGGTSSAGELCVGGIQTTTNPTWTWYQGRLCHSFLYDKELSGAEVTAIYGDGAPQDLSLVGPTANLKHWCANGDGDALGVGNMVDLSGAGNHGTFVNGESDDFVADVPAVAATPQGMYCNAGGYQFYSFESTATPTFSGWVKTTATDGYLWGNSWNASYAQGALMYLDGGRPVMMLGASATSSAIKGRCDNTINDGAWHHVVGTVWLRGGWQVKIWVDGVAQPVTIIQNNNSNSVSGTGFSIGARNIGLWEPLAAKITEVAVWRMPFQQAHVDELYGSGVPQDLRDLSTVMMLAGWWRMGSAYSFPGSSVNMEAEDNQAVAPGPDGYATRSMWFDGSNDYVSIGDADSFNFEYTEPFSISAWIQPYGINGYRGIFWKHPYPGYSVDHYGGSGGITYNPLGDIRFYMRGNPSGNFEVQLGSRQNSAPYGTYFHFVVTYDGSNSADGIRMYVDGVEWPVYIRYGTVMSGTIKNSGVPRIGYDASYWKGWQDETSVWDKELTPADVAEIYNGGDPADLSTHTSVDNLVGWWRLGEGRTDATMINMEAGDIKNQAPGLIQQAEAALAGDASVTALGGYLLQASAALEGDSSMTGELLGDLEIAADVVGGSSFTGAAVVHYGASAEVTGGSEVLAHPIVKVPKVERTYSGPLRTTEQVQRLVGFQPDRKPAVVPPKFTVDPNRRR